MIFDFKIRFPAYPCSFGYEAHTRKFEEESRIFNVTPVCISLQTMGKRKY